MGRPALKRGAIERSALELFVEKGVDGTSIRDIAERAGVTEGALYRHHKSKNDLVRALFFEHYAGFGEIVAEIRGLNLPYDELVTKLVHAFFGLYDKDSYVFCFIMLTRHKLLEEVRADDRNPVELLSRILRDAAKRGEIPPQNTEVTTELLVGMVLQTAMSCYYKRLSGPVEQYSDQVAKACLEVSHAGNVHASVIG